MESASLNNANMVARTYLILRADLSGFDDFICMMMDYCSAGSRRWP